MKKETLRIVLFAIIVTILIILAPFTKKYLMPPKITMPEAEKVWEEKNIELKGVTDSKKLVYETDNAIIKISYNAAKEYFLDEIKFYKNNIAEEESLLASRRYNEYEYIVKIIKGRKENWENIVSKGGEFMNWLENQKDEKEIDVTSTPHEDFLNTISFKSLISRLLKNGEVDVYDKNKRQDVKSIKYKAIETENQEIYRYYLPNDKTFFELSFGVYH